MLENCFSVNEVQLVHDDSSSFVSPIKFAKFCLSMDDAIFCIAETRQTIPFVDNLNLCLGTETLLVKTCQERSLHDSS